MRAIKVSKTLFLPSWSLPYVNKQWWRVTQVIKLYVHISEVNLGLSSMHSEEWTCDTHRRKPNSSRWPAGSVSREGKTGPWLDYWKKKANLRQIGERSNSLGIFWKLGAKGSDGSGVLSSYDPMELQAFLLVCLGIQIRRTEPKEGLLLTKVWRYCAQGMPLAGFLSLSC